jgi:hypothetical protein
MIRTVNVWSLLGPSVRPMTSLGYAYIFPHSSWSDSYLVIVPPSRRLALPGYSWWQTTDGAWLGPEWVQDGQESHYGCYWRGQSWHWYDLCKPSFNPSPLCVSVQMLFSRHSAGLSAISCFYSGVCWFSPMRTWISGCSDTEGSSTCSLASHYLIGWGNVAWVVCCCAAHPEV